VKIENHEIQMQSSHIFSREYLESEVSFSSFMLKDERTVESETLKSERINQLFAQRTELYTILGFIEELLGQFNKKVDNITQLGERMKVEKTSFVQKYKESESMEFSTIGHIETNKGIFDVNLKFSMSRSFVIENQLDRLSLFDPLIINIDGDIPDLSRDTFSFDLDNDGESDQISKLGSGSGFLALDKNSDGVINQGSELFGTLSGNGFEELRKYDEDNNKWIDENDPIFDKLQIWLKNEDNSEKELVGLGETGIGAIYLDSLKSDFSYKTETNQTLGEMRECGIFLKEDGTCGAISQIDLAKTPIKKFNEASVLLQVLKA